jgi:hypothetical protein
VIATGDLVLVSSRGRLFYGRVTGSPRAGRLAVAPLERHVRERSARVDDVVEHWSRTRTAPVDRPASGQLQLEGWER